MENAEDKEWLFRLMDRMRDRLTEIERNEGKEEAVRSVFYMTYKHLRESAKKKGVWEEYKCSMERS